MTTTDAAGRTLVTTPSGHVYVEPTTVEEIRLRMITYAQGVVECWDTAELPPAPTWGMVATLLQALDRANPDALAAALDVAQADLLKLSGRLDGYEERLAKATRQSDDLDRTLRRIAGAIE